MDMERAFVAGVSFVLGLCTLLVGVLNVEWCFRLPKARWVERRWGRLAARGLFVGLGLLLILLAAIIARG